MSERKIGEDIGLADVTALVIGYEPHNFLHRAAIAIDEHGQVWHETSPGSQHAAHLGTVDYPGHPAAIVDGTADELDYVGWATDCRRMVSAVATAECTGR